MNTVFYYRSKDINTTLFNQGFYVVESIIYKSFNTKFNTSIYSPVIPGMASHLITNKLNN